MTYYRHREFGVVRTTGIKGEYITIHGSRFRVRKDQLTKLDPNETLDGFRRGDYVAHLAGDQGQVWDLDEDESDGNSLKVLYCNGSVGQPYTFYAKKLNVK